MLKIDHTTGVKQSLLLNNTTSVKQSLLLNTNNSGGSFQSHMGLSSEPSLETKPAVSSRRLVM